MKLTKIVMICLLAITIQVVAQKKTKLETQKDSISYIIGTDIAKNLMKQEIGINPAMLSKGFEDQFNGKKLLLTDEQIQACMASFQQQMKAKQSAVMAQLAEKNKGEETFFSLKTRKRIAS